MPYEDDDKKEYSEKFKQQGGLSQFIGKVKGLLPGANKEAEAQSEKEKALKAYKERMKVQY